MSTERIKTAQALGSFDGLHIGHMSVLQNALSKKNYGLLSCVLIFDEHPQAVLARTPPPLLQTEEDKLAMIKSMGLTPRVISFREIHDMTPEEFFENILLNELNAGAVCCGNDFRFGKGGAGNVLVLKELCEAHGIECIVCGEVLFEGEPVSSTRIRRLIISGDVEKASKLLGRYFGFSFIVVHGDKIGRTIGFPTINQRFPVDFIVPRYGVYASQTFVDNEWKASITNIGVRPTLTGSDLRSETHIIGYSGDLYDKKVPVRLVKFIRPEKKFDDLSSLTRQIEKTVLKQKIL